MPYYRQLGRFAQHNPTASPVNPATGLPNALTPPIAAGIPSAGGVPSISAPLSTQGMPPGTILTYTATVILEPRTAPLSPQQTAAIIGASLSPLGVQLIANKLPNFGAPAKTYTVSLTVQLLNSFPTTSSVQGAVDQAVDSAPGLAVLSSSVAVAGTSVAGQTLGPSTPPSSSFENISGFAQKYWPWLLIGAALWVGLSEARI
jgi:hypothetical protein